MNRSSRVADGAHCSDLSPHNDSIARKRRGRLLRELREYTTTKIPKELAGRADVNEKTIRDNWENHGGPADWGPFWRYMRVLEEEARAGDTPGEKVAEFVRRRDEVVPLILSGYSSARARRSQNVRGVSSGPRRVRCQPRSW